MFSVGHVVLAHKKAHILLVTLNKQGRADEHKYMDHWIDDTHFHWQSQNATDPTSKRGDNIIRHAALGIDIHLFVRDTKLAVGKAAPFMYHGRVRYQSHQGSRPMSIVFGLDAAVGYFAGLDLPSLRPYRPNGLLKFLQNRQLFYFLSIMEKCLANPPLFFPKSKRCSPPWASACGWRVCAAN
ncbi:hypothetical protein B9Z45_08370 [Limnohabitans sp. 2KL-17]|nr:hypothetical protein B9Z45_08370 [Limnohabitans sp. 2KL-17]